MHRSIPLQRYAGSVVAFGSYGLPAFRVTRRGVLLAALIGLALAAIFAGWADGPSGMVIGLGLTSVDLRQQAIAKLKEAKGLASDDGAVSAENLPRFQELMGEFRAIDESVRQAEEIEGNVSHLHERLSHYTEAATGSPMRFRQTVLDPKSSKTMGQQFIESEEYKRLKAANVLSSPDVHFRTAPVTVGDRVPYGAAATDVIQTESGGPATDLIQPYRPGIVLPLPQRPLVVRDLFPNVDMPSGDTIEYAAQIGFDNAAAAVAQASTVSGVNAAQGLKPQSSIAWEERSTKATWIATWMVATRQALSDETQLASLIDNQGRLMIRLAEDTQLLSGNGTPPNLRGILNQSGIQTLDLTGEDNLDGIRTARRLVSTGVSRLQPTFVVLNPEDSEEFDLLKDANDNYRGGNPIGNFGFDQSIWRLQRVESEAISAGTALVGARAGATVFDREPLRVLTADQHSDFFIRNLIVILFEERLAFPVYFPTAFVEVTLADWAAGS